MVRIYQPPSFTPREPEKAPKKPGVIAGQNISQGAPKSLKPHQTADKTAAVVKTTTPAPATPPVLPLAVPTKKNPLPLLKASLASAASAPAASPTAPPSPPAQKKPTPPSPPAQRKPSPLFSSTPLPQTPVAKKTDAKAASLLRPTLPLASIPRAAAPPSTPPKKPLLPQPPASLPPGAPKQAAAPVPPPLSKAARDLLAQRGPDFKKESREPPAQKPPQAPTSPQVTGPQLSQVPFSTIEDAFHEALEENKLTKAFSILEELPPNQRQGLYNGLEEKGGIVSFFTRLLQSSAPCVRALAFAFEAMDADTFRKKFVPTDEDTLGNIYEDDNTLRQVIHLLDSKKPEDKTALFTLFDSLAKETPLEGTLQFIAKTEKDSSIRKTIFEYVQGKPTYAAFAAHLAAKFKA